MVWFVAKNKGFEGANERVCTEMVVLYKKFTIYLRNMYFMLNGFKWTMLITLKKTYLTRNQILLFKISIIKFLG